MFEIKYHRVSGNTGEASQKAIALLKDPVFKHAVFSTSPWKKDGTHTEGDGPETNWPYFSATIRVGDDVYVFDSTLLNAARPHRAREVSDILDVAQQLDAVFFVQGGARFTASMTPEAVAKYMSSRPLAKFTRETRAQFWTQVSTLNEAELESQRQNAGASPLGAG